MSATIEKEYPSLAEIVRQETDGGRLIVQFYLGFAYGSIDGFRDHHRAAAARRIDKIAPGLVKEFLLKYHNAQVRESLRTSLFPMGSREPADKESPAPRGPNAFQRKLNRLVRQDTADGRSIVDFLVGVMEGYITGFRPHHRLEAANQLATHITSSPSPSTGEGWGEGEGAAGRGSSSVVPAKAETQKRDDTIVVPAQAGTQRGGAGQGSHSPAPQPNTKNSAPSAPSAVNPPISPKELARYNFQPHHLEIYDFARDEITGGLYAFDHIGPIAIDDDGEFHRIEPDRIAGYERATQNARRSEDKIVRPEPVEGQCSDEQPSPSQDRAAEPKTVRPEPVEEPAAEPKTVRPEPVEGQCSAEQPSPPQLTTNNRQLRTLPGPGRTPSRSPPA